VYAWYDDAWWNSKLGLMEGRFDEKTSKAHPAPLEGRYHDGPQRCVIGKDTAGIPVYSGRKVKKGNCSGALEVFYGEAQPYYQRLMSDPLQPLTVITRDGGTEQGAQAAEAPKAKPSEWLEHGPSAGPHQGAAKGKVRISSREMDALRRKALDDVHAHLMAFHADQLKAAGVNPAAVPKPKTLVISNWTPDGKYTPGIGSLWPPKDIVPDQARKAVRKPLSSHALYVINQDYGYQSGWAVGSLAMAEKVLQAELGMPRPAWLDEQWYTTQVVAKP